MIKFISILSLCNLVDKYHVVPDAQAHVIQGEEACAGRRFAGDVPEEPLELFRSPEHHFVGVVFPDGSGFSAGVLTQAVIPHGIIHDGGKLVVDGAQVGGRIGIAVLVPVVHQFILPFADAGGGDLRHGEVSEKRKQLFVYDILFLDEGVLPEPVAHVLIVNFHKVPETHGQVGLLRLKEIPLPFPGLALQLEAAFLFLLLCPGVIRVIEFAVPGFCLFVVISGHKKSVLP